jgi:nitrite reductase/ring-hydroxylating ferredoxin subunit
MSLKRYKWHKIAEAADADKIAPDSIGLVEVEGKKICITKFQDKWYGFAHTCPHAGGLMEEGYQDGEGNVICPIHHYAFSLRNGHNTTGEGYKIKTYPVESRPEGLFVGVQAGGLFHWP